MTSSLHNSSSNSF